MNAKQTLLKQFHNGVFALLNAEQIATLLHLGRREMLAVRDILYSLVRSGELLVDTRGRFGTAKQFGARKGTISGSGRGFAFFVPEDGSQDLFLPHRALKGALHGDTVLACLVPKKEPSDEGEVLAILSRGYHEIVGTYRREGRAGYLVPDERKFDAEIFIPAGKQNGCKNGEKAVAKITSYEGNTPAGEIQEILGRGGDLFTEELSLIRAHNLRESFSADVIKEAEKEAAKDPAYLEGRKDFRETLIITVDGEDTRDIDDAISIYKDGGVYHLGVHIADVTHYVKRNLALDKEAFKRGTSVYFPDRVLPMLPPALSNGICSLNEGVDRLTLSCLMTVDRRGKVLKKRIVPSVIRSRHRMTYTDVTKLYERDSETMKKYPDLVQFVNTAMELTVILKDARRKRGGVNIDVKEAKILYADGKIFIPDYDRSLSHEMIEQFMVLANESVAELMTNMKVPFVYRVHEKPSEDKANDFAVFLEELGIAPQFDVRNVTPKDYQNQLAALQDSPLYSTVNRVMLRSMMKAVYAPENIGHFGLASDCYCHFTSPIRRYPDLCIHRIIKEALLSPEQAKEHYSEFVREAAMQSSQCERNAAEAERDVDALYIVAFMQDKIGEEYEATLSGVTSFGLFAELKNTVEGFIPIETLPDDAYELHEDRFVLRGTRNVFRLGDTIKVKVVGVDWGTRRVQFAFLEKLP